MVEKFKYNDKDPTKYATQWARFKNKNDPRKILVCNDTFFHDITKESAAYWLGYLFADGCVTFYNDKYYISVSSVDYEHVELFRSCMETNAKISKKKNTKCYQVVFGSDIMASKLIELGCTQRKSLILVWPELPEQSVKHFIRGYFDGDGSIFFSICKGRSPQLKMSFVGTENFLSGIKNHLTQTLGTTGSLCKPKRDNIYQLSYAATQAKTIANYIYKDATVFLYRKKEKFFPFI